jgi:UDP-N-acetylmuramoyl-tripeptide--D-alanyl-D-alanine ligase
MVSSKSADPRVASGRPEAGRGALSRGPVGSTLVDDSYNANPGSVRAAIDLLAECPPRRWLALGAMLELGPESGALHREMGEYARERGLEGFIGVGEPLREAVAAFGEGGEWYADCQAAAVFLRRRLQAGDTLVIKGSRGVAMERLLAALAETPAEAGD